MRKVPFKTFQPNVLIAPPPVHVFLTKSPLAQAANLSSIRTVVNRAAPIGKSVVDAMCQRLNIDYVINGIVNTKKKSPTIRLSVL